MNGGIILISDLREHRARKEEELKFYQAELVKLNTKLGWITQEIRVTQTIIELIEHERVLTPEV